MQETEHAWLCTRAGADNQMKVWDVRTFKPVHSYFTYNTISRMDISQKGLLAVGYGRKIQVSAVFGHFCVAGAL